MILTIKKFSYWVSGLVFISLAVLTGCIADKNNAGLLDEAKAKQLAMGRNTVDYWNQVKPILDNRCVVCHGCYEAPCQIKLTSPEGVARGAFDTPVYEQERLLAADPTRLGIDAQSTAGWRKMGFYPIVDDKAPLTDQSSLLLQAIMLKKQHPLPNTKLLDESFTLGIKRENVCSTSEDYQDDIAEETPLWGMPYALPGLSKQEMRTLETWIAQGAHLPQEKELDKKALDNIKKWEDFLNKDDFKNQLMARYLYEHLFLANLYFEEKGFNGFYKIYRSKTPPGEKIEIIPTRRPYDDPKVDRVYYRIQPYTETVTLKTSMPYKIDDERMKLWTKLFLEPDYEVKKLPSYKLDVATNPFKSFEAIPANSRYRFLLSEAQFTVMNFIKGPVCRGSVSLNVIRDQFWVFFVNPDSMINDGLTEGLEEYSSVFALANQKDTTINIPYQWDRYLKKETKLLNLQDSFLMKKADQGFKIDLDMIWDGDGNNDNAALTIFRHYNSASVEKGLLGNDPNTVWLIDYPLLERIHYLLAAGYDVYGNVGHQILSRLHMDFLRMDGERNFLLLLPQEARQHWREFWYRDADPKTVKYLKYPKSDQNVPLAIDYKAKHPKREVLEMLRTKLEPVISKDRELEALPETIRKPFEKLESFGGEDVALLPDVSFVQVEGQHEKYQLNIIKNSAHTNLDSLFDEEERLVPAENTVTVTNGITSAYPNVIFFVKEKDVSRFVDEIMMLESEEDVTRLMDHYAIRRTNPEFWEKSDEIHRTKFQAPLSDYGMLDYGRLINH